MARQRLFELCVGCFMIIGLLALVFLAFKVSGLTSFSSGNTYRVTAAFDNIGDLKVRAPVTVAGVNIGQITEITLNPVTYRAVVTMDIDHEDKIPVDSTANIFTAGLIGSNYISLTPGFSDEYVKNGGKIDRTNQAMILQNIIGQLLYSFKSGDKSSDAKKDATPVATGGTT
jgi:phospholipid/cholesterol/gamma-HCH transport system substrate-binding protein